VLVGLANHAAPDGTAAFPAVRTLVRYTDLSERTVRTALDRLAAEGIIAPCDPAIVAAKIKRADQRPQGWDLAMHLVRDDLDDEDLTALQRQFPGLTSRVALLRSAGGLRQDDPGSGVQLSHPVARTPVDNGTGEVRPLHPVDPTGCNHRSNGVQPPHERGAAAAPEPSFEPSRKPSAAVGASACDAGCISRDGQLAVGGGGEFFTRLGPGWPLTGAQRRRLAPIVAAALEAGWDPAALATFVSANTAGVRSPAAVLAARLSPAELPAPAGRARARPAWCGQCSEQTRRLQRSDGADAGRCPRCHPLAAGITGEGHKASETPLPGLDRGQRSPWAGPDQDHNSPASARWPSLFPPPAAWACGPSRPASQQRARPASHNPRQGAVAWGVHGADADFCGADEPNGRSCIA
jgi:hypothetical protein